MTTTRSEIEELEEQILHMKKKIADLKRSQPRVTVDDFEFETPSGKVRLSELFGEKPDLLVVHNMGKGCTYCTLWADGFNGVYKHLEDRSGFAVVSPDPIPVQQEFAASRGWAFRMVRDVDAGFSKAMGMYGDEGYWPGVTGFRKLPDGTIQKVASAGLGPGDDFCAVWHMLDLLSDGDAGWEPKYSY